MSNERQETVADIVAEMRIGDLCAEDTSASRPEYINNFLASYADRIEAALKREREAGAAAAQICGEIGEIVGREATTEKSSAVGNANAVRGIAQEMLNTSMQDIRAESINGWASRLAAACEQTVTDCNRLNNAAAMREALQEARRFVSASAHRTDRDLLVMDDEKRGAYVLTPKETLIKIDAALSSPQRNCDRFATLDDARNAFFADYVPDETCSSANAFAIWLFDEARWTEKKIKAKAAIKAANETRQTCVRRLAGYCSPSDPNCPCYCDGKCIEAVLDAKWESFS